MNNFYLLKYESENLGDDIQTVAVMDILDSMNIKYSFIYRDLINGYYFNPNKNNYIIFNGWFTNGYGFEEYYSSNQEERKNIKPIFPPKGNFKPIIFSYHISEWGGVGNREVHPKFLDDESVSFYKSSDQVGCRDTHTLKIMESLGVKAYLSNCITLSFDKDKYKSLDSSEKEILFVDVPDFFHEKLKNKINELYVGKNIKKITHKISAYGRSSDERFNLAREHLKYFCNAEIVVTSRLHVLLPCLAFETPVIFIVDDDDATNSRIVDYMKLTNTVFYSELNNLNLKKCFDLKFDKKLSKNIFNNFKNVINRINSESI